jgi:homoserine O-succinyltransferase
MNLAPERPILRGFSDDCVIPVSRWTEMRRDEIEAAGPARPAGVRRGRPRAGGGPGHRALYIFNHFEYDSGTLNEEYRPRPRGLRSTPINVPMQLLPRGRSRPPPQNRWRSHAHLLYGNWISEVYLTTPFDIAEIGEKTTDLRTAP